MCFDIGRVYNYRQNSTKFMDYVSLNDQAKSAFHEAFNRIGLVSFLVEHPYVDRDYLEDYSNYYARCYESYGRHCHRVHFFRSIDKDTNLTTEIFNSILLKKSDKFSEKTLQKIYLGFMVIKPFDNKKIGRTCIVTYNNDVERNRKYNAIRDYSVNLFGVQLSVKSMAFQEQDQTVAMCASVSLWSCLNVTGKKHQHLSPSTSEVTKLALSDSLFLKHFPNNGLSPEQIAVGIKKIGLTPLIIRPKSNRHLKSVIYSYLQSNVPIVCGISLHDLDDHGNVKDKKYFHAITINGFSFENGRSESVVGKNGVKLYSSRMTKFYAHDDQLCPFARHEFIDKFYRYKESYFEPISTSWLTKTGTNKIAKVESLIVPLYHKVRISYEEIFTNVKYFNRKITSYGFKVWDLKIDLEWEIFLTEVNDFKHELREKNFVDSHKYNFLIKGYPKYLWRAKAMSDDRTVFELVYDATESKNSFLIESIVYEKKYYPIIDRIINK